MKKMKIYQKILVYLIGIGIICSFFFKEMNPLKLIIHSCDDFIFTIENWLFAKPIEQIRTNLNREMTSSKGTFEAEIEELRRENEDLRKQIKLSGSISDAEIICASVIARPIDLYNEEITINVGKSDGLDGYYAVMSPDGMIGRITEIHEHYSKVALLTDESVKNQFAVRIITDKENDCDAILQAYNSNSGTYRIKLLATSKSIEPGMKVVTSGMGGIFPSGLLIGVIDSADEENADGICYQVKPSVDFSSIRTVSVIKRKTE